MNYLTVSLYHPRVLKGGAQYVAKDLHDAARADPDVNAVMLAAIDGISFPEYARTGGTITALPDSLDEFLLVGTRFNDFFHTIYDARRQKAVQRFLEDHRPNVIHVHHSLWVGLEFLQLARKTLPDVTILYTLHEYQPICYAYGQLYRHGEKSVCPNSSPDQCVSCYPDRSVNDFALRRRGFRRAFSLVDHFVAPSDDLRRRYVEWGIPEDKITAIPNGHNRQRPKGWSPSPTPGRNVFGFFGQFVDAKGVDVLLRAAIAAAERTSENIQIKIFGGNRQYATADYAAQIDVLLQSVPPNLSVAILGTYSRDNVFDLMASVDWVVVPSVWPETFGLVVSEAWDARRPVLASDVGGLGERVQNKVNGLTFQPGSDIQLRDLILECCGNTDLWRWLSHSISDEIPVDAAWQAHKPLFSIG